MPSELNSKTQILNPGLTSDDSISFFGPTYPISQFRAGAHGFTFGTQLSRPSTPAPLNADTGGSQLCRRRD